MSRALLIARRWLIGVAVIFFAMTAIDYAVGVNSGAMAFADEMLRQSAPVRERIGEIRSVRLRLWGFSLESEYSGDRAELDLAVKGSTGAFDVTMKMKDIDGRWTVVSSSIPM